MTAPNPMTPEYALERAVEYAEGVDSLNREIMAGNRSDSDTADVLTTAAASQAWSFVSLAASNLVPPPEEVAMIVAAEMEGEARQAVERLAEVEGILDQAKRSGPRHPGILQALDVIRRRA